MVNLAQDRNQKKLYSNLKFLKFTDQLDALEGGRLAAPVHIRIKPINACNHDCWYCSYHVDWLELGSDMVYEDVLPKDKIMEIIEDLIEMKVKAVTFSGGGEPLMYPHIVECLENLSKGGIKVAALTNGSNLKGKVADAFAQYGSWIRLSMDGWDGPSYVKARNVKDNEFDRVMDNVRNFAKRKSHCVIGISFIVDKNNFDHLFDFALKVKEAGVNHVSFSGTVVSNEGLENNLYHEKLRPIAQEQIRRIMEELVIEGEEFSVVDNYHDLEERFDKEYDWCPFMQFQTVIGADAMVYTCHDKAYNENGILGSIKNRRFKDFWFSEENRKKMKELNPKESCNHHCVADKRNKLILDYVNTDKKHIEFV